MSNISTIFDVILTTMDALFTGGDAKTRLPDPYELEENPLGMLRNGYGLRTGPSESPEFEFNSTLQSRSFDIPLTRELRRLESDTTVFETVQKQLLEDLKTIQVRFENVDQLGVELSIQNISVGGSTGIEFLNTEENGKFLTITQTFIFEWSEEIGA